MLALLFKLLGAVIFFPTSGFRHLFLPGLLCCFIALLLQLVTLTLCLYRQSGKKNKTRKPFPVLRERDLRGQFHNIRFLLNISTD